MCEGGDFLPSSEKRLWDERETLDQQPWSLLGREDSFLPNHMVSLPTSLSYFGFNPLK